MFEKLFKLSNHNTTAKREIVAGITTFLTMSYIIFVHPSMLAETGMDQTALITVTCLIAFLGTAMVAFFANAPLAMAPGMGLNAFFTYSLVMGLGVSWEVALGVVFISGIIFLLLTVTGFRTKIIKAIPRELQLAIAAGIGLFIAFIGFQNLGLIVNDDATLVKLGEITLPVLIGLVGLMTMAVLEIKRVKGGILIGILLSTSLALLLGLVSVPEEIVSMPPSIEPVAFKLDIMGALSLSMIMPILSFMFVDLFDSVGTIVSLANEADMIDEDGNIEKVDKILAADALATTAGAVLGTSTTTTFVESATGVAEGGRTGLTSLTTGVLFLIAMFLTPVIAIVPAYATAPALIIVGAYMFKNLIDIDFSKTEIAIPTFLTIIMMPLTYSISMGIAFGFVSYVLIEIVLGKTKDVSPYMWGIALFSLIEILF